MKILYLIPLLLFLSLQGWGQTIKDMETICQSIMDDKRFIEILNTKEFKSEPPLMHCPEEMDSLFNLTFNGGTIYKMKKFETIMSPFLFFHFTSTGHQLVILAVVKRCNNPGCSSADMINYSCIVKKKGNRYLKKKVKVTTSHVNANFL